RRPAPPAAGSRAGDRVLRPEDLLDHAGAVPHDLPEPLGQLDRLLAAARLDQREAHDALLGLGERAVGDGDLAAGRGDARAAGLQPAGRQQHPCPGHLLDEPAHLDLGGLVGNALVAGVRRHHQEAHRCLLRGAGAGLPGLSLTRRTRSDRIDIPSRFLPDYFSAAYRARSGGNRRRCAARRPGAPLTLRSHPGGQVGDLRVTSCGGNVPARTRRRPWEIRHRTARDGAAGRPNRRSTAGSSGPRASGTTGWAARRATPSTAPPATSSSPSTRRSWTWRGTPGPSSPARSGTWPARSASGSSSTSAPACRPSTTPTRWRSAPRPTPASSTSTTTRSSSPTPARC